MKLNKPLALNEQGRRGNQEDSVWPAPGVATAATRTFAVCDGMGGHEAGEVASSTVCAAIGRFVATHPDGPYSDALVEEVVGAAYDMLDSVDRDSATPHRMGTTLTLLCLTDTQAVCAHIGDSRIYQVRPDGSGRASIVYKSSDHSLVNELVKAKVITPEEAVNHPRKNVITRAMQSVEGRRDAATVRVTNDVRSADYFLMCTDGVTEAVSDQAICEILGDTGLSDQDKVERMKALCLADSHDNFSLYLVPVAEGIGADAFFDSASDLTIPLPGQSNDNMEVAAMAEEVAEPIEEEQVAVVAPAPAAPVSSPVPAPAPAPVAASGPRSQPYIAEGPHSQPFDSAVADNDSSWKKIAMVACGLLLVCVAGIFAYIFLFTNNEPSTDHKKYEVEYPDDKSNKGSDAVPTPVRPKFPHVNPKSQEQPVSTPAGRAPNSGSKTDNKGKTSAANNDKDTKTPPTTSTKKKPYLGKITDLESDKTKDPKDPKDPKDIDIPDVKNPANP
ncbi:MAG: hypothetical protein HDS53_00595 [Barnesiella sp.]|nr:hypothetical protein [Barnesiella sp.]